MKEDGDGRGGGRHHGRDEGPSRGPLRAPNPTKHELMERLPLFDSCSRAGCRLDADSAGRL